MLKDKNFIEDLEMLYTLSEEELRERQIIGGDEFEFEFDDFFDDDFFDDHEPNTGGSSGSVSGFALSPGGWPPVCDSVACCIATGQHWSCWAEY